MITATQAHQIISLFDNSQKEAMKTGIAKTSEEIKRDLYKIGVNMTGSEFKSINTLENFDLVKAARLYYTWVASGMFPNKMIYAPCNTDLLIDAYNKKIK